MSCWVVPTVAAELWGVPVEIVLERARSGLIHSKSENGFTFIDVAPGGESCHPPRGLRGPHPPTFTVVTQGQPQQEDWRLARKLAAHGRKPPAQVPRVLP